jgi:hypothetical protein
LNTGKCKIKWLEKWADFIFQKKEKRISNFWRRLGGRCFSPGWYPALDNDRWALRHVGVLTWQSQKGVLFLRPWGVEL